MPSPSSRWFHRPWVILCMLFLVLGPLALPWLWQSPRFSRRAKVGLTMLTIVYTLWLIAALAAATRALVSQATS